MKCGDLTLFTSAFGSYPPPYGGVATYVYALNEFLKQYGFNCELKIYRYGDSSAEGVVHPKFDSVYKNFYKITKGDTCIDSCSFFLEYPSRKAALAWLLIMFQCQWNIKLTYSQIYLPIYLTMVENSYKFIPW